MTPHTPFVSVIIPVYNGERYLGEAIASVLAQEYRPIEVIVVDDGSTDRSSEIALRFGPPVHCIRQQNAGGAAARAHGVARAKGDFLAFLDSDDLWMPGKLTVQMEAFAADPTLDMVFGHMRNFYSPDVAAEAVRLGRAAAETLPGYSSGAMVIRRAAYERVGPFLSHLRAAEFIEWYSRAVDQGLKERMLPEIVLLRRLHTTNLGITRRTDRTDFTRVAKMVLDRRRGRSTEPSHNQANGHTPEKK